MAKEMVYFNATKQIETITIHYNNKLDGTFVEDVVTNIKNIAKKMGSKVNLKDPKEFYSIQVFVYPNKKLFYKIFAGEIEKRFYSRRRSLEDLYVVKDSDGNIHIVSPRGMDLEKRDAFKRILVMKVLGEYMDEKEKINAQRLLKEAMKPKEEKTEELEEEPLEEETEEEIEQLEEELIEDDEEELSKEDIYELITTQQVIEQIDEEDNIIKEDKPLEDEPSKEEKKIDTNQEVKKWLYVGWLAYVRGKLKKEKDVKQFAKHVSKNGVKKLNKLTKSKLFESYNYSEEYACALVEYVVTTYGTEKFTEFYENPKDIEGIFGIPKFQFNNDVKAFVYRNYTDKQMKMDMDEKGLNEITEIHFVNGGGVNIIKDIECQQPETPGL